MNEEIEEKQPQEYPNIIVQTMEEVMHNSMMPYSEHVILDRALPRVEDGLKPVQRRILYSMNELGITPDKPHRKSARIVGDCLGKYHPHGDKSVYDAMVRMAQPFNMRHMLIDGHGNFGSVDGDSAAAMRYTEARLPPLALELLKDLEKDTVKWSLNFDDTTKEPDMLPGRFPNLLVNGATGIAVGLATNIPPHNLAEVIDGVVAFIENPKINLAAMLKIINGPDFPSGGFLITGQELCKAYETGRGKVTMRAKIHIELGENEKKNIVITELPYQVNKASLLESIMELREEKKGLLLGISEICDESDRNGMRAVIRIKRDVDPREICNVLFKSTNLSMSFGINIVAIADGKPQQMGLMDIIYYYVNYQREIIVRRTKFELEEAKEREHILEGLLIAVKNIDEVIKIIKTSQNTTEAKQRLRERFELSERQAQAILDMRLARLTHLEIYKLEKELAEIKALIARLEAILASKKMQMDVIKSELLQIKKSYREPRRTQIIEDAKDYYIPAEDDAKPIENYVIAFNANGAIKRIPQKNFSMATKEFSEKSNENEICPQLVSAKTNNIIYCFTNLGNCFKLDTDSIPEAKWRDAGTAFAEVVPDATENERVVKMYAINENLPKGCLLFYTREGMVKKTPWSEYGVIKSNFQAIKLKEGDEVIGIEEDRKDATIMFVSSSGMCLNADKSDIPEQGRIAGGVKGMMIADGESIVFAGQVTQEGEICIVSDKAFSKRVIVGQIDVMARYRKGIKIMELKEGSGSEVLFAAYIKNSVTIILHDDDDYLNAFNTDDINIESRTAKGKPLCKVKSSNRIQKVYLYNSTAQ